MAAEPVCLVCQEVMLPGFLTDLGAGQIHQPRWCAGAPEHSFWTGEAKLKQYESGLKVVAFRCPKCEALRLYAPSKATAGGNAG